MWFIIQERWVMLLIGLSACVCSLAFCYSGWRLRRALVPFLTVTIIGLGLLLTMGALLFLLLTLFFGVNL